MELIQWRNYITKDLKNKKNAECFLKAAFENYKDDNDLSDFLHAIRTIIDARGKVSDIAKKAGISRQHLYKVLSKKGNPRFETLFGILSALNFDISFHHRKLQHSH